MHIFRFPYPDVSWLKRSGDDIIKGWPLALRVNQDSFNSMHVCAKEEKVPRKRWRERVWEGVRSAICYFFAYCFPICSFIYFFLYWCFRPCRWWILNLLVPQTTGAVPVSSFNEFLLLIQTACPENWRKNEQLLLFLPKGIRLTALA